MMKDFTTNNIYNNIVSAWKELLRKHGFRCVTIEEICTKAYVSKMTCYKFLPSKIELAKTVFRMVV
jgi:AcrR family transcriptional regulator